MNTPIPTSTAGCRLHPEAAASSHCASCAKPLCDQCRLSWQELSFCNPDCLQKHLAKASASAATATLSRERVIFCISALTAAAVLWAILLGTDGGWSKTRAQIQKIFSKEPPPP